MNHQRQSDDSIVSDRGQSLLHDTPQILPHRMPPSHSRHSSLHILGLLRSISKSTWHLDMILSIGDKCCTRCHDAAAIPAIWRVPDGMGLGIGINLQSYGVNYNPYGHQ